MAESTGPAGSREFHEAGAAACRPGSWRYGPLMLAWLVFGIAAAYGYLLAEAQPNRGDGNWLWSGQVALFVLFAESVLFLRSRGAMACRDVYLQNTTLAEVAIVHETLHCLGLGENPPTWQEINDRIQAACRH